MPPGRSPRKGGLAAPALLLLGVAAWGAAAAAEIKVSTWNLDWLTLRDAAAADLPADVAPRAPADFDTLRRYAEKLHADVVAFQEVDGVAAASRIFDPAIYTIVTIDEDVVQRVGIAVRKPIAVRQNPDIAALNVAAEGAYPLRDGLDVTLALPGGRELRVLVVHLKTGCLTDSIARSSRAQCATLARQIAPLAAWAGARAHEKIPFVLAGDFNRVLDEPEEMGAALAAAAPLLRATAGFENPCWNGAPFIDHIFLGGPARDWLEPDSLRVQIFHEKASLKQRLSDHCPVSVMLDPK